MPCLPGPEAAALLESGQCPVGAALSGLHLLHESAVVHGGDEGVLEKEETFLLLQCLLCPQEPQKGYCFLPSSCPDLIWSLSFWTQPQDHWEAHRIFFLQRLSPGLTCDQHWAIGWLYRFKPSLNFGKPLPLSLSALSLLFHSKREFPRSDMILNLSSFTVISEAGEKRKTYKYICYVLCNPSSITN